MFVATLALAALAQEPFVGTGFSVQYPRERLVPVESVGGDIYALTLFDPEDPTPIVPPLEARTTISNKLLYSPGSWEWEGWAIEARDAALAQLEARGATEIESARRIEQVLGGSAYFHTLTATLANGEEWVYTFASKLLPREQRVLVRMAHPAKKLARRTRDVKEALASLELREFKPHSPLRLAYFGVPCVVPIGLVKSRAANESQAFVTLEATGYEMELRWFQTGDAARAPGEAAALRARMPAEIEAAIGAADKDYTYGSSERAIIEVGSALTVGWKSRLAGSEGSVGGWRYDAVFPVGSVVMVATLVVRDTYHDRALEALTQTIAALPTPTQAEAPSTHLAEGLLVRLDPDLAIARSVTDDGVRFDVARSRTGSAEEQNAREFGVWFELTSEYSEGEFLTSIYDKLRRARYGKREPVEVGWLEFETSVGKLRGQSARYRFDEERPFRDEFFVTVAAPWHDDQHLVVAYRAPDHARLEQHAIHHHVIGALRDVTLQESVPIEVAGLRYEVAPASWRVAPGADGRSSTATTDGASVTLRAEAKGGRLFGPPPELEGALRERVASLGLVWAFEGEAGEPVYEAASVAGSAGRRATVRVTDDAGAVTVHVLRVTDVGDRRLWVESAAKEGRDTANRALERVIATVAIDAR